MTAAQALQHRWVDPRGAADPTKDTISRTESSSVADLQDISVKVVHPQVQQRRKELMAELDADHRGEKKGDSNKKLVRVIDVVLLRMRTPNFQILVETEHVLPDGRQVITNRLPATKRRQGENVWATARRMVEAKLRMLDDQVNIREGFEDFEEEIKESEAYPGLSSIYRKHYIDANVGEKLDKYAEGAEGDVNTATE